MVFTRRNLDWWCERSIFVFVLAALVFAPLAFGAVYTWTFLVVQTLVLGILLAWLVRIWGGPKPKLLWPPLAWAVVGFTLYAIARYLTADIEYIARLELIRVLLYAFLLLAIISNLYDQDSAETVTYTLTAVAVLASSYAIFQFAHHSNHVWHMISDYPGRASGTYINPDHFAGFLELVLPLPLAFLLAGRIGVITRVLLAYATLAIMAGMTLTFSRGGWIAAASGILMLLVFLLFHRNHRLRAALLLFALVTGGMVAFHVISHSPAYMRRVAKVEEAGPGVVDLSSRFQMWDAAARMWRDHPWWGVGPGHFNSVFDEYRPPGFQLQPDHAHCDYLELFADWGTAGGVIVLVGIGIFAFGLVQSWPHVRREESDFGSAMSSRYAFFLGAVSGLFALAVHSWVDFNLHITANALTGIVVLALVASNIRFSTKRYWVRLNRPLQWVSTLILAGLAAYFCAQIWRRGGEMIWTSRAEHKTAFSPEQVQDLQKAFACEPENDQTVYNIAECFWAQSLNGNDNYAEQANQALSYYATAIRLNSHDPDSRLRSGMCLDWLGRYADAEKFMSEAERLSPNGEFVAGNIGWHYVQVGDYSAARQWFIRANKLSEWKNETAKRYLLDICEPKLMDRASGRLPMIFFNDTKGR